MSNRQLNTETIFHSKRIQQLPATLRRGMEIEEDGADDDDKEQEEMARIGSSRHGGHGRHHLHPRRSRGVANDESEDTHNPKPHQTHHPTVLTLDDTASPPSTSSTPSDKAPAQPAGRSQRFTDPAPYPHAAGRASVLLTLLACGTGSARRNPSPAPGAPVPEEVLGCGSGRSSVQQGVVVRRAMEEEIRCMSENPRFGNLPAVEKEYFSGSIVEAAGEDHRAQPGLKRSASYNEERYIYVYAYV